MQYLPFSQRHCWSLSSFCSAGVALQLVQCGGFFFGEDFAFFFVLRDGESVSSSASLFLGGVADMMNNSCIRDDGRWTSKSFGRAQRRNL